MEREVKNNEVKKKIKKTEEEKTPSVCSL